MSLQKPQSRPAWQPLRFLCVVALALAAGPALGEKRTPSPKPAVPAASAPAAAAQNPSDPKTETAPSTCQQRLVEIAAFTPLAELTGPGQCGATDVVRLEAILLKDKTRIPLSQPATLRCSMAEGVAQWVRDDMAVLTAAELGAPLAGLVNYESYECRGQNRVTGARMSEHGRANAFDIRGVRLASGSPNGRPNAARNSKPNGTMVEFTSPIVSKGFREALRKSACARFTTVLGPGSDRYHEDHIHVDLAERVNHYRLCQWDVREPPMPVTVPLPVPRPGTRAEAGTAPLAAMLESDPI